MMGRCGMNDCRCHRGSHMHERASADADCVQKLEHCVHDWEWRSTSGDKRRNEFCDAKDLNIYARYKVEDALVHGGNGFFGDLFGEPTTTNLDCVSDHGLCGFEVFAKRDCSSGSCTGVGSYHDNMHSASPRHDLTNA